MHAMCYAPGSIHETPPGTTRSAGQTVDAVEMIGDLLSLAISIFAGVAGVQLGIWLVDLTKRGS